jgi:hypothetical protein
MSSVNYKAEPTLADLHADDSFVRGVMGPIGSGKSVGCCIEIMHRMMKQDPWTDGVRYSRWACLRNTYPELLSTLIKTWEEWFPSEICKMKFDKPISALVEFGMQDGTRVRSEVFFIAMDKPKDIKKLKSLELTGAWMNEASEMSKATLDMLTGRVGRYPPNVKGGPSWRGIIMDTNPPDDDSWYYKLAEVDQPEGYKFFKQPPALIEKGEGNWVPNPDAENIKNHRLGFKYYLQQVPGKDREWIKVFIQGQYGSIEDGRPVFPQFKDFWHVSESELMPMKELPLIIGMDFGLDPAAVFCQITPKGQLVVLDELVTHNMGIRQFATEVLKPHLANHYPGFNCRVYGDPAGEIRSQADERTCFEELNDQGIHAESASSDNSFAARRDSVVEFMTRATDGQPGLLLSPTKCPTLRKGLNGRYKYEIVQTSAASEVRYKERPLKNSYSHICDAFQYACVAVDRGRGRGARKRPKRQRRSRPASMAAGY